MKSLKHYLILTHRYAGIPLSLVFIVWFLSGIVMIYTGGMPSISEAEYLARQPDLELSRVSLDPAEAAAALNRQSGNPPELRMLHDRPLYQFTNGSAVGVFADSGEILRPGEISSRRLVAEFLDVDDDLVVREAVLEQSDQWTLGLQNYLPLQKFRVTDGLGSQVYVSGRFARVVLHTTARDRLLAWAGAIPHWFYLESLRENPRLWARAVVWVATLGCFFTLSGIVLLFTQWRRTRPFSLSRSIPYRGLHRWHYLLGGVFGVFTLTWIFSGLLSMEPYAWTNARGYQLPSTPDDRPLLADFSLPESAGSNLGWAQATPANLKLIRFVTGAGKPQLELLGVETVGSESPRVNRRYLDAKALTESGLTISPESMVERLQDLLAGAGEGVGVVSWEILGSYDSFYYPGNNYSGALPPLPVLRVKLNDPDRTWYYLDAASGRTVFLNHRSSRLERWLYNGFHSLDFSFWYQTRPLWDIGMILLLLGGATLSGIGGFLGARRLNRR